MNKICPVCVSTEYDEINDIVGSKTVGDWHRIQQKVEIDLLICKKCGVVRRS